MADAETGGRSNQKRRARKALLEAAARLMKERGRPTFDEVAEEALVSRATAYRYFQGIEPLLVEASLDVAMPEPEALFADDHSDDPAARMIKAEAAVDAMVRAHEVQLRTMMIHALKHSLKAARSGVPARQNRRTALIEAALAPLRGLDRPTVDRLAKALALVVGTEARLVFRDVLQLDDEEALGIKQWMIRALVEAAQRRS
ncbi:MAG TPA: helix-turn-helix domain-containing protein [Allosphingosinicella sp.]|jgi:AcrR family transcriptional regulator